MTATFGIFTLRASEAATQSIVFGGVRPSVCLCVHVGMYVRKTTENKLLIII